MQAVPPLPTPRLGAAGETETAPLFSLFVKLRNGVCFSFPHSFWLPSGSSSVPPGTPPGRRREWCGRAEGAAAAAPVCQCVCPSLLHCLPPPLLPPSRLPSPPRTAQPPDRCGRAGGRAAPHGRAAAGRERLLSPAAVLPRRAAAGQRRAGGRGAGPVWRWRRPWRVRVGSRGCRRVGMPLFGCLCASLPRRCAGGEGPVLLSPLEAPGAPGRTAPGGAGWHPPLAAPVPGHPSFPPSLLPRGLPSCLFVASFCGVFCSRQ